MKPRLADLYSCAGGAAWGYHLAGFEVVGFDIAPQPNYPFTHHVSDALTVDLSGFDAVHASPPCQHYAPVTRWRGRADDHPDLVAATRAKVEASGLPWVIENVPGAPIRPDLILCGSMFGLRVRRHRWFECSWPASPFRPPCSHRRDDLPFEHKGERAFADAMGCGWMTAREAREAVPWAYTFHIGQQLRSVVEKSAA